MSASAARLQLAESWLAYAREDLASAELLSAAYHCQQAAEKAMKALLALADVPFRQTHDLRELGQTVSVHFPELATLVRQVAPLTAMATRPRYPGPDGFDVDPEQWAVAHDLAARMVAAATGIAGRSE